MGIRLLRIWQSFRASYWFLPLIMVLCAVIFGPVVVWLDSGPTKGLLDGLGWYQQSKPDGAREVLSTIAGSMITVAGVVFSITIVAISFAANQYGPRILTNFMSDRGNQITLGTFIATFVYSVVVLRTIYSGDQEFVPQLAILIALVLALLSIIVLIYFIHHVPESIHINTVTARVGLQLIESIGERFPSCIGDPPERSEESEADLQAAARQAFSNPRLLCNIRCQSAGYVQLIDEEGLLDSARASGLVISINVSPGGFVFPGVALATVSPASDADEEAEKAIRDHWSIGASRTPDQDVEFLIDELVEIAARALSTGVNDPYTAITCMDWLMAALAEMIGRRDPSPYRVDKQGELRVIALSDGFHAQLEEGFGRLRSYAATDVNAASHFMDCLASLANHCQLADQVGKLGIQADAFVGLARSSLGGASLDRVEEAAVRAYQAFQERLIELRNASAPSGSATDSGTPAQRHKPNG